MIDPADRGEVIDVTTLAAAGVNQTVLSGALLLALPIAVLGGLVSFFSPCVLPLVPGYMSYVTGVTGTDLAEARRGRMVAGASLFVLGFTAVFVSGGALFGYFGWTLQEHKEVISKVLGVLMILLGLVFMGLMPWLHPARVPLPHASPTGAGRRAGAGRALRRRLDAVPRPDPHRRQRAGVQPGQRGPRGPADRRVLPRARPAVRARRGRLPQGARRLRLGQAALRLGDADRRRHDDRARGAAAHRCVGQHRCSDMQSWASGFTVGI